MCGPWPPVKRSCQTHRELGYTRCTMNMPVQNTHWRGVNTLPQQKLLRASKCGVQPSQAPSSCCREQVKQTHLAILGIVKGERAVCAGATVSCAPSYDANKLHAPARPATISFPSGRQHNDVT